MVFHTVYNTLLYNIFFQKKCTRFKSGGFRPCHNPFRLKIWVVLPHTEPIVQRHNSSTVPVLLQAYSLRPLKNTQKQFTCHFLIKVSYRLLFVCTLELGKDIEYLKIEEEKLKELL